MHRFIGRVVARALYGGLPTVVLVLVGVAAAAACIVTVPDPSCPSNSSGCSGKATNVRPSAAVARPTGVTAANRGMARAPMPATKSSPTPTSPAKRPAPPLTSPSPADGGSRPDLTGSDPRADAFTKQVDVRRSSAGCGPLRRNEALRNAAMNQAAELWAERSASHVDSKGATARDRASRLGYQGSVIEMVAHGTRQVEDVVGAFDWVMADSDLLDCKYHSAGAAVIDGVWVLVLGDV